MAEYLNQDGPRYRSGRPARSWVVSPTGSIRATTRPGRATPINPHGHYIGEWMEWEKQQALRVQAHQERVEAEEARLAAGRMQECQEVRRRAILLLAAAGGVLPSSELLRLLGCEASLYADALASLWFRKTLAGAVGLSVRGWRAWERGVRA